MKKRMLFVVLMLTAGILLANPGRDYQRNKHHSKDRDKRDQGRKVIVVKPQQPKFVVRFKVNPYARYNAYRNSSNRRSYNDRYDNREHYRDYRYKDMEVVSRRDLAPIMDRLQQYYERGLINKKEYFYAKDELRNMVGKLYPHDYADDYVEEVIDQIADLHRLRRRGMISSYEYSRYKAELLKML